MHSSAVTDAGVPTRSLKWTTTSSGRCSMAWTSAPSRVSSSSAGAKAFGERVRPGVDELEVAEDVLVPVGEPLDQREVVAALEVEQRTHERECLLADAPLDEEAEQRVAVVALDDLAPAARLRDQVDERAHRVLEDVGGRPAALAGRQAEVEGVGREVAAADALPVQVDEGVLVLHPEWRRLEAEALVDEVLAEPVLLGEAHRPELAVHPPGEPAVGVDASAQPVARLEDRDPMARFLEQQAGRQAGDAGPDDDDVATFARAWWEAVPEGREEVDGRRHRHTLPGPASPLGRVVQARNVPTRVTEATTVAARSAARTAAPSG